MIASTLVDHFNSSQIPPPPPPRDLGQHFRCVHKAFLTSPELAEAQAWPERNHSSCCCPGTLPLFSTPTIASSGQQGSSMLAAVAAATGVHSSFFQNHHHCQLLLKQLLSGQAWAPVAPAKADKKRKLC